LDLEQEVVRYVQLELLKRLRRQIRRNFGFASKPQNLKRLANQNLKVKDAGASQKTLLKRAKRAKDVTKDVKVVSVSSLPSSARTGRP